MIKVLSILILLLTRAAFLYAQDPLVVAPAAYKLQFENDWVRVTRVHYAAKQKVPLHEHVRFTTIFAYLNDAGPVRFVHEKWAAPVLVRPAVKARSFRIAPTPHETEVHSVENPNDTASDFLRIELKTPVIGRDVFFTRFPEEVYDRSKPFHKYHFNNDQFRISRVATPAKTTVNVESDGNLPFLIVFFTQGEADGKKHKPGDTVWIDRGGSVRLNATRTSELEVLRVDLRSSPRLRI